MSESFEFESHRKLTKIREELSRKELDVRNLLADIEKIRVQALKKIEEMRYSAQHDIEKVVQDMFKEKSLNAQVKEKLNEDIDTVKGDIEKKCSDLKSMVLQRLGS